LTFVVPYSPGGGFDSQARGLAPTLEEKLGASGFAMENQPGAGGVLAINELMARGAPEGDTIAIANLSGILSSVLADDPVVEFDPAELGILGRIDAPPSAVVTATDGPYQSIEDIIEGDEEFLWGTAGPGSTAHLSALILGELLDFDYELAPGFEGTTEIETAIIRGEVDGLVVPLDSALPNIEAGDLHVLAFIHPEPVEEFEDVPLAVDLAEDPESQEVLEAHTNLLALLRTIVTAGDVEPDRLAALQQGYAEAVEDEELLDRMAEQDLNVDYMPPDEVEATINDILDAPDLYVSLVAEAFE
jgi:tripartite-type tricarboxylate transporter receptor subunit TctC